MKITISGKGGVGKGTTTNLLAQKLDYKVLSGGDFFRQMAKDKNMTIYEFDQLVRKNPEYDYKLDDLQKEYGKENDNFVLESRLGWYFVPDSFKIKLTCKEDERIKRVAQRDGLNINETEKKEEERLDAINERYKKLYNIEKWDSDDKFDLIVDTTNNPPEKVVEIILEKIKNK